MQNSTALCTDVFLTDIFCLGIGYNLLTLNL